MIKRSDSSSRYAARKPPRSVPGRVVVICSTGTAPCSSLEGTSITSSIGLNSSSSSAWAQCSVASLVDCALVGALSTETGTCDIGVSTSTRTFRPRMKSARSAFISLSRFSMASGIEEPMLAPNFGTFAEEFLELVKSERKAQTHRRYSVSLVSLKEFFGSKRLSEITSEEIDRFKQVRLKSGRKGSTVNRDLACLRRLLRV